MSFSNLGLRPELLRAVAEAGYSTPTPIQAQAIPLVLAGRDLMGGAQTGTGKTAAFVLPILQRLIENAPSAESGTVRALVLTPTRELAIQVDESVATYGARSGLRSVAVYGGASLPDQVRQLNSGVEIVVATPGRLLDLVWRGTIDFGALEFLVLDEADRMLDMGFIDDIRTIIGLLPPQRQSLLFSATFSAPIKRLADTLLRDPALVQVTPRNSAVTTVEQLVLRVEPADKPATVARLIKSGRVEMALVFVRTKHGADRLANQLDREGIRVAAIHGDKSQSARIAALENFKAGRVKILVATEVAARGLDIDALPHVINYDMPRNAEDYVHRIGRTGRAGASGIAISLVSAAETDGLREIEKLIGRSITVEQRSIGSVVAPRRAVRSFADSAARAHSVRRSAPALAPRQQSRRPASAGGNVGWSSLPGERRNIVAR